MAFIYEVNGQRVEFEKEPTERDIDEAAKSLRPAPQPTRKVVEGAGGGAIVYPNMGRRPESQQDREASKEMAPQTLRGLFTGALGAPADILNLPGTIYSAASGQPAPYKVPYGSEQFNEMLPFRVDTPHANLGRFGGEVLAPVPSLKGLKAIPGAVRGAGDVVSGAVGTGTGYIARPGRAPQGYQIPSQRNPIGSTYTPPEELAKFERGELPYGQMPEQRPISELPQGKLDQAAMMLSGGNIPNSGQGAKAFGERLGETYRNPLTAAADIGSMFFTGGVPVLSTLRGGLAGAQALADMRLAKKGFTPELPKILDEYQTGVRPMPGIQPGPMPRGFQAAGPVSPGGIAQPTSAAQAAMATTQRVARTTAAPRPPAQPFVLPDAGTHYAQAEQVGDNFGDIFNKAVTARATDLLRDARQNGKSLTSQQANDLAFDEIKEFRRNNVEAFKPAPQPPELVGPVKPADVAMAETKKAQEIQNAANKQRIEKTTWQALQQRIANGGKPMFNEQKFIDDTIKQYGEDPFGTGKIDSGVATAPTTPAENTGSLFATSKAETPTTKTITPEQQAKRDTFVNTTVKEHMKGMKEGRADNKEIYAEQAETMRQMAAENKARGKKDSPMYGRYSEGQNMNPKDVFTERKAVADMVYSVSKGNVTSKNKSIIVRRQGYNQMADDIGITLDWDTAPRAGKTIKETRKIMDKWMMDTINKEIPELGLYKRRESYAQQQKRYIREAEAEEAAMTPEQREARDKQMAAMEKPLRTMDSNPTLKKLLNKGESPKTSSSLQAAADKAKANKGNAPPGVMKMETGQTPAERYDPWMSKEKYDEAMFNRSVGFDKSEDFVAKTKLPGGNITSIESPKATGERVDFSDKTSFTKIKDLKKDETTYNIGKNDTNTKYTFDKNNTLQSIEVKKGDRLLGEWNNSNTWSGEPEWQISHKNTDGSYSLITEYDTYLGSEALKPFKTYNKMSQPEVVDKTIRGFEDKVKKLKEGK